MLEDLLTGRERSSRILIKDSSESPGRVLLLNWISHLLKWCDQVILVCFERPPQFFSDWLPADLRTRVLCVFGHQDLPDKSRTKSLLNKVAEKLSSFSGKCAVVIDSLTMFILADGTPTTCSALHRLSADESVNQVLCVLHSDVHDEQTCALVEHTCVSVITLSPSRHSNTCVCHVRHCRTTGKVFQTNEFFSVNESFDIEKTGPYVEEKKLVSALSTPDQHVPAVDVPFNLSLTEKERLDRSQVRLPYLKDGSGEPQPSPGLIHYEPDEADDFDEEDPDDDLNI